MDLEARIKELETQAATLESTLSAKDSEIASLKAENESLSAKVSQLETDYKEIEKELAIERANAIEKDNEVEADKIYNKVLSESSLPSNFHSKVREMVNYKQYCLEDGTLAKPNFEAAFKAEVSDWESRISSIGGNLGVTATKPNGGVQDSMEEKRAEWRALLGRDKK
jgi:chromosome segregation ATPase